jgi:hypothetical protein
LGYPLAIKHGVLAIPPSKYVVLSTTSILQGILHCHVDLPVKLAVHLGNVEPNRNVPGSLLEFETLQISPNLMVDTTAKSLSDALHA